MDGQLADLSLVMLLWPAKLHAVPHPDVTLDHMFRI